MQNKCKIGLLALCISLGGCEFLNMKEGSTVQEMSGEKPIARSGDSFLYLNDVRSMVPKGTSAPDSVNIVERYVNNWIKKQLMIKESASKIDFDETEIERKMLDYRYALMVYEYQKYYIDANLDQEVSEEDIQIYYNENTANFELKQNIIRCLFIKVPDDAPKLDKLRELVKSNKAKDRDELKSYCFRFAISYSLEDSLWLNFDEVVNNSPLANVPNKVQFLGENNYTEASADGFLYIMRILNYKISDQISPLEFVKDDIRNIILNKRKLELAKNLEEDVFKQAQKNKEFEIYK